MPSVDVARASVTMPASPSRGEEIDGITVLGVQFPSVVSLFMPLRERADLALVHVNDWLNLYRAHFDSASGVSVEPPPDTDWREWSFPPGWANRFAPWMMPILAKRVLGIWRSKGWRNPRLVVTFPYFLPVAREIGMERTLYRPVDNYQAFWRDRSSKVAEQEDQLVREAAATVATASLLADWLRERVPASSDKIHYVPNGIHPEMVRSGEAALRGPLPLEGYFAERLGDHTGPVVGNYGTIAPRYGIEMLAAVTRQLPKFRFVLMGPILSGPADYAQTLANMLRLPNVITTGRLKEPQSREILWQCDVMLLPTPLDELGRYGSPNRLWTYMGTGRPIVSNPLHEVIKFGDLVYPAVDAEQAVAALRQAAQECDPSRVVKRIEIAKQHTWPVLAERVWSILSRMAREARAAPCPSPHM